MNKVEFKLIHYLLNMDYKRENVPIELQTNQLINSIMNDFVFKYENAFNSKYVILDFLGDSYSLLAYTILKNIQAVIPFNLLIYGKKKKLKQYLKEKAKRERFVSKRTVDKLRSIDKALFVSCYNPTYQVNGKMDNFKIFDRDRYNIIERFTPQEFYMAFEFYQIPREERELLSLQLLANGDYEDIESDLFPDVLQTVSTTTPISVVKLTGDNEFDNTLLNTTNEDGLIFYYCKRAPEQYPLLFSNYQYFIKKKTNIPSQKYLNINSYDLVFQLNTLGFPIDFIGDFSQAEKERWLYNVY